MIRWEPRPGGRECAFVYDTTAVARVPVGAGAWPEGRAAQAVACDAILVPVVTGDIDPAALEDLVRLCVELHRLDHHDAADPPGPTPDEPSPLPGGPDRDELREEIRQAVIGKAVDLLSGPGGLASHLRRRQLGARLAGPSLPLDIGHSPPSRAG